MVELEVDLLEALRAFLAGHVLFSLGVLLVLGFAVGKVVNRIGLPEITGYILAGILAGGSVLHIVPPHVEEDLVLVTEVALGLIALTIGGEFFWVKLKRMGSAVVIITLVQLVAASSAVTVALWLFRMPLPFAALLGAIASATAPAATVAIVQSLRAQGKFIDYLYGVVALDDAGAVILFGVVFAVASSSLGAGAVAAAHNPGALLIVIEALGEVVLSFVLGGFSGVGIHLLARRRRANSGEVMITTLSVLFMTTATAVVFHLSPLLANMAAGAVVINLSAENHRIFRVLRPLAPPIYALFFVIAGAELRFDIFTNLNVLLLGGVYIVTRAAGKYGGVWLGCRIAGTEDRIRNYLGICMLPQAGVAIGLVLLIQSSDVLAGLGPEVQATVNNMVNIILLSVFVNELIGPPLSRFAVIRGNNMRTT